MRKAGSTAAVSIAQKPLVRIYLPAAYGASALKLHIQRLAAFPGKARKRNDRKWMNNHGNRIGNTWDGTAIGGGNDIGGSLVRCCSVRSRSRRQTIVPSQNPVSVAALKLGSNCGRITKANGSIGAAHYLQGRANHYACVCGQGYASVAVNHLNG